MEESKAVHRLQEAADLVGMVEDLLSPSTSEKLSGASWAGLRITLRNVREMLQSSHSVLSQDLVGRSKVSLRQQAEAAPAMEEPRSAAAHTASAAASPISASESRGSAGQSPMTRRDLKASLEKFIERQ